MDENIIKKLMASIECSACGRCYELANIRILGHHEDLWFLSVLCPSCHAQYLAAVVVDEEKVTEVITDLTEAELDKVRGAGRLTAEDVLDMHSYLKDFDGDFVRLFSRK